MKKSGGLPEVSQDVREIIEKIEEQEEKPLGIYELICRWSEKGLGDLTKNLEMSQEMRRQISWAGIRVTPAEWWAGFLLVVIVPIIGTLIPWLILLLLGTPFLSIWYVPTLGFTLSALLGAGFYYYPVSSADIEKSEAQSRAIETVMLMSFALHRNPDLRGAAIFASNASEGKLAEDIREGLLKLDQKREYESVRQLLTSIAHEWRDIDEGVRRAIFDILRSTGQSQESLRQQDIAQAPNRVIESTEEQLESKLDSLVLPTMTFMIFGSLVIVGVIGLSPVFGMIGMNFIDTKFFALAAGVIVASFLAFTLYKEDSAQPRYLPQK